MILYNKGRGRHSVREQRDSWLIQRAKNRERRRVILRIICWSRFAVRDAFSNTLMSVRETERADERQRNPTSLILLIQPLPLQKSHPSPVFTLAPPQTGKPPLNNIIACLILTVTSIRGRKVWWNHSSVLLHWRQTAFVCVGGWFWLIPFYS